MARYIDADALREPLSVIIENAEAKELYNIAFNYEHCLKMIEDTPTADVTPRAEVAREIFEEIEKIINEPFAVGFDLLSPLNKALCDYNNGIRKDLLYYISELKKKYLGGNYESA